MRYTACGAETRSVAQAIGAPLIRRNGDFSITYTEDLLQVLGLAQDLRIKATWFEQNCVGKYKGTIERKF